MGKAKSYDGRGWKGQSLRHSRARKHGYAGGNYANPQQRKYGMEKTMMISEKELVKKIAEDEKVPNKKVFLEFMSRRFPKEEHSPYIVEWAKRFKTGKQMKWMDDESQKIYLEIVTRDTDGDGTPDYLDCKPKDPKRQGTNEQVATAFSEGKKDSSGTLTTDGRTIYSYGTPIAYRDDTGKIIFNSRNYSQTTSRHQNLIKRAVMGKEIVEVSEQTLNEKINDMQHLRRKEKRNFQEEDRILPNKLIDTEVLEERNEKAGYHFFEKGTKRFFNSKIGKNGYVNNDGTKAFFVTSEQFRGLDGSAEPRKYTVRVSDLRTGEVDTVGEFQEHSDSRSATNEAKRLSKISNEKDIDGDGVKNKKDCEPLNPKMQGKLHDWAVRRLKAREEKLEAKRIEEMRKLESLKEQLERKNEITSKEQSIKQAKMKEKQVIIDEINKEKALAEQLKNRSAEIKKELIKDRVDQKVLRASGEAIDKTKKFLEKPSTKKAINKGIKAIKKEFKGIF